MEIAATPEVGDPIFPNPLEKFFKAEPTVEDTDAYEEVPVMDNPADGEQVTHINTVLRYNTLKRDRTNIYSSVTRMMSLIKEVMHNQSTADWEALLKQSLDALSHLDTITQEVNEIKQNTPAAENLKALAYQERIANNITKIQSHIRALKLGQKEGIEHTYQALEPETPQIATADVAAQALANAREKLRLEQQAQKLVDAKQQLDAQVATAAAAAAAAQAPPFAAAAMGGATPPVPDKLDALVNLLTTLVTQRAPPGVDPPTGPGGPPAPPVVKDYEGLKPIEIPQFSGDTTEYHLFKRLFEAGHNYRNLDKTTLTLILLRNLEGPAFKLAQSKLTTKVDDASYQQIWDALELRYGGSYNEDMTIAERFNKLPGMSTLEFEEVERTFNAFQEQHEYYDRHDPDALRRERSLLNKQAKSKFTVELGNKYIKWCAHKEVAENFSSILDWLKVEYETALKAEREFGGTSAQKSRDSWKSHFDSRTRAQHPEADQDE